MLASPRQAIRHGFGLCPEDRKVEGIIPELTVRENIVLALQAKQGWPAGTTNIAPGQSVEFDLGRLFRYQTDMQN